MYYRWAMGEITGTGPVGVIPIKLNTDRFKGASYQVRHRSKQ